MSASSCSADSKVLLQPLGRTGHLPREIPPSRPINNGSLLVPSLMVGGRIGESINGVKAGFVNDCGAEEHGMNKAIIRRQHNAATREGGETNNCCRRAHSDLSQLFNRRTDVYSAVGGRPCAGRIRIYSPRVNDASSKMRCQHITAAVRYTVGATQGNSFG